MQLEKLHGKVKYRESQILYLNPSQFYYSEISKGYNKDFPSWRLFKVNPGEVYVYVLHMRI